MQVMCGWQEVHDKVARYLLEDIHPFGEQWPDMNIPVASFG